MILYFFYGLAFEGLGLAAYLQIRRGGDFPLRKQLPWLAAFGFSCGVTAWVDMFLSSDSTQALHQALITLRMILQSLTGLFLLLFGWGTLTHPSPLPSWMIFIPGLLIVPLAYVITYALTTFITPSPLEIPIDIWTRYLLYLPGSILAGLGFMRQWHAQRKLGFLDVSNLMLGAGVAFLFEAFVVGLIVPAAPYGPASYYIYDRTVQNAFTGESITASGPVGFSTWLDYERVLQATGISIEYWRMLSAIAVTFFVTRGLDVFETMRKRQVAALQEERDRAQQEAFDAQRAARQVAESWTEALVSISRHIVELDDMDEILRYITVTTRQLMRSDFVGLAILEDDPPGLNLKCCVPDEPSGTIHAGRRVESPLILNAFRTASACYSAENASPGELEGVCLCANRAARAAAVVRLDLDNHPLGALWIARFDPEPYTETDLIWLECLADQVVLAIQHGLMTAQLQSISIIEERGRIAREMHDGLAQVLGYMNVQIQTLDALLKQGKLNKLQEKLGQMRGAVQVAHADVRENILSLRTTLANEKGLIQSIEEYLEEFGVQSQIETQFTNKVKGELQLSSLAEVQLVCILQEALTNVRKHAQARRVSVRLEEVCERGEEEIVLTVSDDGIGFAPADSKRSFGLQTMRERAQSLQGKLNVTSTPGTGTRVEARFPALQHKNLEKRTPFTGRAA